MNNTINIINALTACARAQIWTNRARTARERGNIAAAKSYLAIARAHVERAESLTRFQLVSPPEVIVLELGVDGVWA